MVSYMVTNAEVFLQSICSMVLLLQPRADDTDNCYQALVGLLVAIPDMKGTREDAIVKCFNKLLVPYGTLLHLWIPLTPHTPL